MDLNAIKAPFQALLWHFSVKLMCLDDPIRKQVIAFNCNQIIAPIK